MEDSGHLGQSGWLRVITGSGHKSRIQIARTRADQLGRHLTNSSLCRVADKKCAPVFKIFFALPRANVVAIVNNTSIFRQDDGQQPVIQIFFENAGIRYSSGPGHFFRFNQAVEFVSGNKAQPHRFFLQGGAARVRRFGYFRGFVVADPWRECGHQH
jgi:hypothetical protein